MDVIKIVKAGRIEWRNTSPMNVHDHPTVVVTSYPPLSGTQPSLIAKNQIASSASQKYGNADVITKIGGRAPSRKPPRRQAETSPLNVPSRNAITVVNPTSPSVQGKAWSTW